MSNDKITGTPMERRVAWLAGKMKARGISDSDICFHLWSLWGTRATPALNKYFAEQEALRIPAPEVYGAYGPDEEYHQQYAKWVAAVNL